MTLIFDPLTLKVCGTTSVTWSEYVRNLSEIKQSPTIIANFEILFAHITSRCDRDLWPLDLEHLQHFGCHVCKFCIKFERNRIIHSWVIDDLARFRRAILGSGELLPNGFPFSGVPGPNFKKLGEDIKRSSLFVLRLKNSDILLYFQTRSAHNWVMLKTTPNFALFDPYEN